MTHQNGALVDAGKAVLMQRLDCSEEVADQLLIVLCERTGESLVDVAHALLDPASQEALIAIAAPWHPRAS